MSIEGEMNLEEYPQLLADMKQRCAVLQHDLQSYTDAVIHRCGIIVFCHLLLTTFTYAQHANSDPKPCSIACNSSTHHIGPLCGGTARLALHKNSSSQAQGALNAQSFLLSSQFTAFYCQQLCANFTMGCSGQCYLQIVITVNH